MSRRALRLVRTSCLGSGWFVQLHRVDRWDWGYCSVCYVRDGNVCECLCMVLSLLSGEVGLRGIAICELNVILGRGGEVDVEWSVH